MKISRFDFAPDTVLVLSANTFTLRVRLHTRLSKRHRRQILLALYRAVRPHFPTLEGSYLSHSDTPALDMVKEFKRPVSIHQALNLNTPRGHEGFIIRTRRLVFGHTQESFAELAGFDRGHLSRIEHGRTKISPRFRTKIELAFKKLENQKHENAQKPTRTRASFRRRDARVPRKLGGGDWLSG